MSGLAGYSLTEILHDRPGLSLLRGVRESDGARVVVKLPRGDYPSSAQIARIRHEHSILEWLNGDRTVRSLRLAKSGSSLALVLEDLGDRSLSSMFRERRPALAEFLKVAIEMVAAVEAIHARGVIHKDIKPQHFVLTERGVSVIDFGIATRLSNEAQTVVNTNLLEGTLAYMSPEQTGRMNRSLDQRTDLYSLGVTFYELLTGRLPFESYDALELVHSHIARLPLPPHEIAPGVPRVLSEIVLKLMAKGAENRYQSASGLKADLVRCLAALEDGHALEPFALATHDVSSELRIPQKLYGRQSESQALRTEFERVRAGGSGLFLISGYSGIGKSALVNELQKQIARGGMFVAGKFDQMNRSVPFAAIATACRGLVRFLLAEPAGVLATWSERLRDALGRNGQLMVDLVPELELVIGRQPAVQVLGTAEAQTRFEVVFEQFLQVFAREGHPLALFLDDLQWADAASLRLLRQVLTSPRCSHLLVIGAYRENEVDPLHPLSQSLEDLKKGGVMIHELALKRLDQGTVTELLCDTLRLDAAAVRTLAEATLRKTDGNPFFIQQFLSALHDQQLLHFDPVQGRWSWSAERVDGALATDNVVDLLIRRLRKLSDGARHVLTLAACIGHEFDQRTLVSVGDDPTAITTGTWEALREGLIVPLDATYRYLHDAEANGGWEELNPRYRFLHDRVHEAAYTLLDASERPSLHLTIGRLLAARDDVATDEQLFEVVRQLNLGAESMSDAAERHELARLNLRAGAKVAAAGAHASALPLLRRCQELLGDECWSVDHETSLRAYLARASCEFMSGETDLALELLEAVEKNARSTLDRVSGRELRVLFLSNLNRMPEAATYGVATARLLGAEFPADDADLKPAVAAELEGLKSLLATRSVESLLDLPLMEDPEKRALVNVLFKTNSAAFLSKPQLSVLIGLKAVRLALEHGNAPRSPYFYGNYGIVNNAVGGDLDTSYRFGKLGIDLISRLESTDIEGSARFLFGAFNCHWREPLGQSLQQLRAAVSNCLEVGNYFHAAWATAVAAYYRFCSGERMDELAADLPQRIEFIQRTENKPTLALVVVLLRSIKALCGQTASPTSIDGDGFEEAAFVRSFQGSRAHHVYFHYLKQGLHFFAGEYRRSLELGDAAMPLLPGMFFNTDHALYRALARAALANDAPAAERQAALETLRQEEQLLQQWANSAPANNRHRHALLAAEIAALEGDAARAIAHYDQAIELARDSGFLQHEALANELCGNYHLRQGRTQVARAYLLEACYAYEVWGAAPKVQALKQRHAGLFVERARAEFLPQTTTATLSQSASTAMTTTSRGLDVVAAIRATQAIAGELELGQLLERLLRTMVESAGAQKGVLVLDHGGQLQVEAVMTVEPNAIRFGVGEPIERTADVAASIVQYVARSKETVLLANAAAEARFARDPYVERHAPRSLLCTAMLHQGRLVGVLYLENNAATRAFSAERVELLQFVAAQAAVAVENARLYGELRTATDQLRRSNETLELEVAQRTDELRRTLTELWSEMDLARKIQTVLLPSEMRLHDYDISAVMVPASTVGGDYYDVIPTQGSDWVLIGDVSGHGVTAGLTMMMVQTAIRTVVLGGDTAADGLTPARVLSRVNAAVRSNLRKVSEDQYMTITGLQLRGNSVRYSGLHQDILVYRARSRRVERVETTGVWIGLMDDISPLLSDDTLELSSGDIMLLFTDGLTEALIGDKRFGTDGLASTFERLAVEGADNPLILKELMSTLVEPANDDVTIMAVRYCPRQAAE